MTLKDKVARSFAEVGPAGDFWVVDEYLDESLWHVAVDDKRVVFAELDEARGVIALSAEIGRPPASATAAFLQTALIFNHGWTESGGARLSLAGPDGSFWLIGDIAAEIEARPLAERIQRFAQAAQGWSEVLAGRADAAADAMDEINSLSFAAIRI